MKPPRKRLLKIGTLLAASALIWSCVAPVFPVPPPGQVGFVSRASTDSSGAPQTLWTASGGPLEQAANATYFVFDRTLGSGVIATAHNDGSFTAPEMAGVSGDQVLVYYKTPVGDYSDSLCVLLTTDQPAHLCPGQ
jgi:hypothetical protein